MPGRSRQRRSLDTAAAVQAAATELFGRRGFAGVGMDEVAAACGRTKGAVYHHFKTKEELFQAVFSAEQRRLVEHVLASTTSTDAVDALLQGIATYLETIAADDAVARITLIDAPGVMGWMEWRHCEGGPFRSLLATSLGNLADAGRLRDATLQQHLVDVILGAITEAALVIATSPDPLRAAPSLVRTCRSVVGGLVR
jgi:AcrR family transcriptional regulator